MQHPQEPAPEPRGPLRVLIVLGHPRKDSLCAALADAYGRGALQAGADVRRIDLCDLRFDPNVTAISPRAQRQEDDLHGAIEQLKWADHLVLVFPTWWGTLPALLKGFLDRTLLPGFAFAERCGPGYEGLWKGKSAHLLTTMDTPPWVYRWIYGSPGLRGIGKATLGFCGVQPVRRSTYGSVKDSTPAQRSQWLRDAQNQGARLIEGVPDRGERRRQQIASWLTALRLQFYPMTWAAYLLGALGAAGSWAAIDLLPLWLGLACLFTLEAATVFSNDYFDFDSDRRNRHYGPFNGGSRVLVEGRLDGGEMRGGIAIALAAFMIAGVALMATVPESWPVLLVFAFLALGYTVPPVKLSWRGWGELDVALTHSVLAVGLGYLTQGGTLSAAFPWLIGLPMFAAILPAIALAGIPDYPADRAAGKGTLAVRFGIGRAVRVAQASTLLALMAAALIWPRLLPAGTALLIAGAAMLIHAVLQVRTLERYLRQHKEPGRIDALLVPALSYILWFVLVPLLLLGS